MPRSPAQRIATIKRHLTRVKLICSGTLLERTKVCSKLGCRCATDPDARHGPYYEWNRLEAGRLRHRILSREEAERIREAQASLKHVRGLLEDWEKESVNAILGPERLTERKKRT